MADIELVVKIPEEEYNYVKKQVAEGVDNPLKVIIANGTLLPKGHGRILDEKDILDIENNNGGWYDLVDMPEYIAGVKAIIEADKAESDGKK